MAINYTLHLDFQDNSGFIDYSHLLTGDNFTRELTVGDIGTHEVSTLTITLWANNALFSKLLEANNFIKVKVDKNSSPYFRGIIRPNMEFRIEEKLKNITLDVIDNSYLLEQSPAQTKYWENKQLCDTTDTSNSLIHLLLAEAGLTQSNINITNDIPAFLNIIKIDDRTSYDTVIEKLLFEYGYNYYFNEEGKFTLIKVSFEGIAPTLTLDNSNIIQPLEISKEENIKDGIVVSSDTITYRNNELVYRGVFDPDKPALVSAGMYYPPNANITDIYQNLSLVVKSDTESLVYTKNHFLETTQDEGVEVVNQSYTPETAQVYFKNNNTDVAKIYKFDIRAEVYVKGKAFEAIVEGDNLDEYHANYIYSEYYAKKLAKILRSRQEHGNYTFTINSTSSFPIGTLANLQDTTTNLNLKVFIYSKSETDGNPIITYRARGVTDLEIYDPPVVGLGILETFPNRANDGEDAISIQIFSSNGNIFRDGQCYTEMFAYVWQGNQDITDQIDASKFTWQRFSGDTTADASWNTSSKAIGKKSVLLTPEDVTGRTVFICNVEL